MPDTASTLMLLLAARLNQDPTGLDTIDHTLLRRYFGKPLDLVIELERVYAIVRTYASSFAPGRYSFLNVRERANTLLARQLDVMTPDGSQVTDGDRFAWWHTLAPLRNFEEEVLERNYPSVIGVANRLPGAFNDLSPLPVEDAQEGLFGDRNKIGYLTMTRGMVGLLAAFLSGCDISWLDRDPKTRAFVGDLAAWYVDFMALRADSDPRETV